MECVVVVVVVSFYVERRKSKMLVKKSDKHANTAASYRTRPLGAGPEAMRGGCIRRLKSDRRHLPVA